MTDRDMELMFEELIESEITRRRLLRQAGAGALGLSLTGFLAACGDGGGDGKEDASAIPKGQISDTLNFSNWPYYIEPSPYVENKSATLNNFEKKYGTKVKYTEEINENVEFFGKVRQQYAQGRSGGRDLHVVTDWLCARMQRLGYVQKLDKSAMPNVVKNIETAVANPDFDPKREFSVPWQTGQVLLIYRRDKTGKDITNVNELFDSKYKGKVTMLSEMRDTVGSVLLADGVEPEKASLDQAMNAIDRIEKAARDGQIRRFTGNDYVRDLLKGDSYAILGWSGDAVSAFTSNPNVKYKQPEHGFMIFTDSMQIPVGAPHAFTAEKFMDFVYDPEVQAKITAAVNYVPPVKGTKKFLLEIDPELGNNPLIFPDLSESHNFKSFPPEEEADIEAAFQRAVGA
jgi:spermidine/putrescine transport system substrate-binding protein